ncbi:hypothetical protein CDL12_08661 [Handroanthus impetiginosus]|uniref:BZIP domain-containing protein n=1 Tax=Handroanthus impetiginosus TaxID=429701 RepID=A0A2G9HMK9_9LAMI|nr:hypothetical protein CDL12_08661 [Handroanthus impetiginosus]
MSGAAVDDDWVKAAMTDDMMVVELLMRLRSAAPPPPPLKPAAVPLEWSVRQRRSKPVSVTNNQKKQSQRASPTTPLSWSGATSLSGGSGGSGAAAAGGCEESSRPHIQKLSAATRSKVNGDSEKTTSKRSRKKKTLAELKDEENLLIKEKRDLKREIDAVRMNLEKQRAINENLKRRKIELPNLPDRQITTAAEESVSDQLQQKTSSSHPIPPVSDNDVTLQPSTSNGCCPKQTPDAASDSKFVLPDLNFPCEEDPCPDVICGVS